MPASPPGHPTERIVYVTDVGKDKKTRYNEEIFVMGSDGSGRTRLTNIPGNDH